MATRPKNYPAAQALIDRAMKVDPALAADIQAFARSREYGLVFEPNRPEAMRLYGKPINVGDIVHVLPERGKKESDENRVEWRVLDVDDGTVSLAQVDDAETMCEASVDDVVAVAKYDQPIYAGLRETGRVERGGGTLGDPGDKPYHVVINGENYHALEALEFCYAGKVDCIYIDPPYNGEQKDWKYNNDYVGKDDKYRHSKWLTYMEDRLKLAKKLLNPNNSVLIVTIDEKEYLRLGMLLEQLFPPSDTVRIQMVSSVINPNGAQRSQLFTRVDEYIYCVMLGDCAPIASSRNMLNENTQMTESVTWFSLTRSGSHSSRADGRNAFYPIYVDESQHRIIGAGDVLPLGADRHSVKMPDGVIGVWPLRDRDGAEACWQLSKNEFLNRLNNGAIHLGQKKTIKGIKTYAITYLRQGQLNEIQSGSIKVIGRANDGSMELVRIVEQSLQARTIWNQSSHDATTFGTKMLINLFGENRSFPFPKSLYAVEDTLRFFIKDKPNALVVDFFAGSGTTAHAVMRLNKQDGGMRRSVLVTNNEVSASEQKQYIERGIRQGDDEWEQHGIARYITWPRIQAAITGLTAKGTPIEGEYGVKTDEYIEVEGDVLNPATGNKMRGKFFKKAKMQSKSVPDVFPMADGLDENAVFFDLTYEDPELVEFGEAFAEVAPLLWMRAGCRGRIIEREEADFAIADNYAVLFDYAYLNAFAKAIDDNDAIATVFVVTADDHRYANAKKMFPGRDVVKLYESYLHSFQIASEGALS